MIKNKRIIFTAGTWDLFHIGHLEILKKSKSLGDYLIVGVSTDELVFNYKGVKPVVNYSDRFKILSSCRFVDKVVKQTKLIDISILKKYSVDCVTVGSDWKNKSLAGLDWMISNGSVIYLPYTKSTSTTDIKRKIIKNSYEIIKSELYREQKAK